VVLLLRGSPGRRRFVLQKSIYMKAQNEIKKQVLGEFILIAIVIFGLTMIMVSWV
jgi:hypothetical protein